MIFQQLNHEMCDKIFDKGMWQYTPPTGTYYFFTRIISAEKTSVCVYM